MVCAGTNLLVQWTWQSRSFCSISLDTASAGFTASVGKQDRLFVAVIACFKCRSAYTLSLQKVERSRIMDSRDAASGLLQPDSSSPASNGSHEHMLMTFALRSSRCHECSSLNCIGVYCNWLTRILAQITNILKESAASFFRTEQTFIMKIETASPKRRW